jgi:hypothetical protein
MQCRHEKNNSNNDNNKHRSLCNGHTEYDATSHTIQSIKQNISKMATELAAAALDPVSLSRHRTNKLYRRHKN